MTEVDISQFGQTAAHQLCMTWRTLVTEEYKGASTSWELPSTNWRHRYILWAWQNFTIIIHWEYENLNNNASVWLFLFYIYYPILLVVLHKGSIAAWDNVFNNLYIYLSSFPIFYVFVSLLPQDFIVFELKTSRQAGRWWWLMIDDDYFSW